MDASQVILFDLTAPRQTLFNMQKYATLQKRFADLESSHSVLHITYFKLCVKWPVKSSG